MAAEWTHCVHCSAAERHCKEGGPAEGGHDAVWVEREDAPRAGTMLYG